MRIITKKQLNNKEFQNKFLNVYPLHYHKKDKNGNWILCFEVRGISNKIKENFNSPQEILRLV